MAKYYSSTTQLKESIAKLRAHGFRSQSECIETDAERRMLRVLRLDVSLMLRGTACFPETRVRLNLARARDQFWHELLHTTALARAERHQ